MKKEIKHQNSKMLFIMHLVFFACTKKDFLIYFMLILSLLAEYMHDFFFTLYK